MRNIKIHFFIAALALLMTGCTSISDVENKGNVVMSIVEDYGVEIDTKAETLSEATGDYLVEIKDGEDVVKSGSYHQFKEPFQLASTSYTLSTQSVTEEEALSSNENRGLLRLAGSTDFVVNPGNLTTVRCTCNVKNARVSVDYDDTFKAMFKNVIVTIEENSSSSRQVIYDVNSSHSAEGSYGYFNIDSDPQINVSVSATLQSDEVKSYSKTFAIAEGQWSKITLKSNYVGGQTDLDINVDTEVISKEQMIEVDPVVILTLNMPAQSDLNVYAKYFIPNLLALSDVSEVDNKSYVYDHLLYELSSDNGNTWSSANFEDVNGVKVFNNLTPNTPYKFRVRYFNVTSDVYEFTTEAEIQLPNNSFEEYSQTKVYEAWVSGTDIYTYGFGNDWKTNNNSTIPTGVSGNKTFWTHDAVVKSTTDKSSGSRAVELSTCAFSSDTPGALEIGVIYKDDVRERATIVTNAQLYIDKYSCPSRPTSVSFDYKYSVYSDKPDYFKVTVELYDASSALINRKEYNSGSVNQSSYTTQTLEFDYTSNSQVKVAYVSVNIVSGHANDKSYVRLIEGGHNASPRPDDKMVGSVLTIDNITLNYENYK